MDDFCYEDYDMVKAEKFFERYGRFPTPEELLFFDGDDDHKKEDGRT